MRVSKTKNDITKQRFTYGRPGHHDWRLERVLVSQQNVEIKALNGFVKELRFNSTFINFKL